MTYELAKRLKDAGFPGYRGDLLPNSGIHYEGADHDYIPTLEELIEAIGLWFLCLNRFTPRPEGIQEQHWVAMGLLDSEDTHAISEYGATPAEAVANLWLALQEHPHA